MSIMHPEYLKEELKRILICGSTELSEESVASLLIDRVIPSLVQLGIEDLAVVLLPGGEAPVFFATSRAYAPLAGEVAALVASLSDFGASRFSVMRDDACILGYTGNDLDWVVVKGAEDGRRLLEDLLDGFWYQFFEN